MKILVSSCLLGENVKYSGGNNLNKSLIDLLEKYNFEIIKVCPEVLGGLSTPRTPAEIIKNNIITKNGKDVSKEFELGANKTVEIARNNNVKIAILKENSPSCGVNNVYNGTFSNTIIAGRGVTAKKLFLENIKIFSEKDLKKIEKFFKEKENEHSFTKSGDSI